MDGQEKILIERIAEGLLGEYDLHQFPTRVLGHMGGVTDLGDSGTHFGVIYDGEVTLHTAAGTYNLGKGMYFASPGKCEVSGVGSVFIVERIEYQGLFSIGGPVEPRGRLGYIDGCSDTVLISPVVLGDPCLSLLHMPVGTSQTEHTHPSVRAGIVLSGDGICRTGAVDRELLPGHYFILPTNAPHAFMTRDREVQIVVYHPDSDQGPSHDDHPMLNRTLVGERSARDIPEIRTVR